MTDPTPIPVPLTDAERIAALEKRLAAEEVHTHPVTRAFAAVRARLPAMPSGGILGGIWTVYKTGCITWATVRLALLVIGAVTVPLSFASFQGCSLPNPFVPPVPPLPGTGNRLLVVYDASARMDPDVQSAMWSEDVWRYAAASLAVGPEGTAQARLFDKDIDLTYEHSDWKAALDHVKDKPLPYAVVLGSKGNYEGPLPKGKAEMIAVIKKCFGGAKMPMMARPPPEDYVLTDANTLAIRSHARGLAKERAPVRAAVLAPFDLPEMSDEEIEKAIVRKNADKSWLDDIRNRGMKGSPIPSRDQNGRGYCWAHSSVSATLLVRASNNQPYSDLSAYAVACIIKQYRDEGGWGQESLDFIASRGVPSATFWPQRSVSPSCDKPETWDDAKKHRITEWVQVKTARQFATLLCNNVPVVSDFNWWSHSVCSVRLKSWGPNGSNLKTTIWNSWGDGWSANGMGDLVGDKALPDDMVAPRVVTAAFAARKADPPLYAQAP